MAKKHKTRELAMQMLYLWDTHGQQDANMAQQLASDASEDPVLRQQAVEMASKAWDQRETADRWVERMAPKWPTARQPAIDRNVLRLAVWELTNTTTPPRVVLDEAIELVKHFSTEQSAAFVNGVLDAIYKEHQALITPPAADGV